MFLEISRPRIGTIFFCPSLALGQFGLNLIFLLIHPQNKETLFTLLKLLLRDGIL